MTSAELAEKFKVTRRTAQRWIKSGAPVDDPAEMAIWIEDHQAHFGRSKFTAGETPAATPYKPVPQFDQSAHLTDADYDFTSTEKLIGNLSALAGRAMRDLESARQTTGGGPAVARASKVFNDAVHQLRQALISRDQLQASAGACYSPEEIAYAFAQIFSEMRHVLTDQFSMQAEQALWDRGIVDSQNRIAVEETIKNTIRTVVLPCFCETGAYFASFMLKSRKLSTLRQRQDLFHSITQAWDPEGDGIAEGGAQ
jgi:hypothetical protein